MELEALIERVIHELRADITKQVWKELLQDASVHSHSCALEPLASVTQFARSVQGQALETSKKRFVTLSTIHAAKVGHLALCVCRCLYFYRHSFRLTHIKLCASVVWLHQ